MMINPDVRFYDTCVLLADPEGIFERENYFLISSITLKELENIKTASNKDPDIKYAARLIQKLLEKYPNKWRLVVHTMDADCHPIYDTFPATDDIRILSDAIRANNEGEFADRVIFVTNDLALKHIANLYFGDKMIESISENQDDGYQGYLEICPSDDELAQFYSNPYNNIFGLCINQYLILKNQENEVIDLFRWDGETHKHISSATFNSSWFGKVQPYNHDIYQQLLCDSLAKNKITMARGPAGSGKSYLALACLMSMLQKGTIDKIIIFCNTVATANSAKLGFYPGSKDEKLLDSQIGNFLASKFGGKEGAIEMIEQGKLLLLPFSDLRGFDTSNMNAGIYITEAQNLDRSLMKLALQRVGEDCICIIDGDDTSQVDMKAYEGSNNGMRRVSKIFRGHDIYGEVTLKNIYRSKIASIADAI